MEGELQPYSGALRGGTMQEKAEVNAMEMLIVYDSRFGNTRRLAQAMAEAIKPQGPVRTLGLDEVLPSNLGAVDLLIVGGPTEEHGLSARMRQFTDALESRAGTGMVAATFDTRYRLPSAVSGSAAKTIAKRLRRHGIHVFTEPQSFFVTRSTAPELESGETDRAASWAKQLANGCTLARWCAA